MNNWKDNKGRFIGSVPNSIKEKISKTMKEKYANGILSHLKNKSADTCKKISVSNKGRKYTKEFCLQKSINAKKAGCGKWMKGKKTSEKTKLKLRNSAIKYMKENRNIQWPCIGRNETEILNKLEELYQYKILRQYEIDGFFIDGYIKELNLAIEIDEPAHKNRIGKDTERQQYIQNKLGCKFLRIEDKY